MCKENSISDENKGAVGDIADLKRSDEKLNESVQEKTENNANELEEKKSEEAKNEESNQKKIKSIEVIEGEREPKEKKLTQSDYSETEEVHLPAIQLPDPQCAYFNEISAFGFSQQGASHVSANVVCQDRSGFKVINDRIVVSAIADGVGSCALSDYGAETAINTALEYLEQYFTVEMKKDNFVFNNPSSMGKVLRDMMAIAYQSVDKKAEELEQLPFSFQSTLTVAIYDGNTLFFAHAGDDGIVAMNRNGTYAMVTQRHKGDEASSVYPLQSLGTWQFGMVSDTVAFVMVTDGVLDAFVRPSVEENRVYYPFIESIFYRELNNLEETEQECRAWFDYMNSDKFREKVTDDISLIGVVNQAAIKEAVKPQFSIDEWNRQSQEYMKKRNERLYPGKEKSAEENKRIDNQSKGKKHDKENLNVPNQNCVSGSTSKGYENKTENDVNNIRKVYNNNKGISNNDEKFNKVKKYVERTFETAYNTGEIAGQKLKKVLTERTEKYQKSALEKRQNNSLNAGTNTTVEEKK